MNAALRTIMRATWIRWAVEEPVARGLERAEGFEPPAPTWERSCSTAELHPRVNRRSWPFRRLQLPCSRTTFAPLEAP